MGESSGNETCISPEISDQLQTGDVETILANRDVLYQGILQHSVKLAALHPAVIKQWPQRSALYVVARFAQWRPIIDDHPGQFTAWEVMATLNNPSRIRRDKHYIGKMDEVFALSPIGIVRMAVRSWSSWTSETPPLKTRCEQRFMPRQAK